MAVATRAWLTALWATSKVFLLPDWSPKICCQASDALNHNSLQVYAKRRCALRNGYVTAAGMQGQCMHLSELL